jgi:hypothetical protein
MNDEDENAIQQFIQAYKEREAAAAAAEAKRKFEALSPVEKCLFLNKTLVAPALKVIAQKLSSGGVRASVESRQGSCDSELRLTDIPNNHSEPTQLRFTVDSQILAAYVFEFTKRGSAQVVPHIPIAELTPDRVQHEASVWLRGVLEKS